MDRKFKLSYEIGIRFFPETFTNQMCLFPLYPRVHFAVEIVEWIRTGNLHAQEISETITEPTEKSPQILLNKLPEQLINEYHAGAIFVFHLTMYA